MNMPGHMARGYSTQIEIHYQQDVGSVPSHFVIL